MDYLSLVEQFGSPLYVYDAAVIRRRIRELRGMISEGEVEFLYAIKANFNPSIVKLIVEEGVGIDAVSIEEVKIALRCGCLPEKIMYTENYMSNEEMDEAAGLGVLINFNSLYRLSEFGKKFGGREVCVRFNPNVGAASHATNVTGGPDSKFGIGYDRVEEVVDIIKEYDLKLVGVHEHIGSGWLGIDEPLLAMDVIFEIVNELKKRGGADDLRFIDFGGGFGVPYKSEDKKLNVGLLGREMKAKFDEFSGSFGKRLKMRFEPGRYIVAESGSLLTRVTAVKEGLDKRLFAGVDTGMNHLVRTAMYGSYHPIENLNGVDREVKKYDVCGNICECADFFARDRELNEITEGDVLKIGIAGAYGMSMANHYQFRALPMEVMIDGDEVRVIKNRVSFEDQFDGFGFIENNKS